MSNTLNYSPLPWHRAPGDNPRDFSRTEDANGRFIFGDNSGPSGANTELIVKAVNKYHDQIRLEGEAAILNTPEGLEVAENRSHEAYPEVFLNDHSISTFDFAVKLREIANCTDNHLPMSDRFIVLWASLYFAKLSGWKNDKKFVLKKEATDAQG